MSTELTGKDLNILFGVGANHALYREDGIWHHLLSQFPGVLFDSNGYVVFQDEDTYKSCEYLNRGKELYVRGGISAIPGYIRITESTQIQAFGRRLKALTERHPKQHTLTSTLQHNLRAGEIPEPSKPERISQQINRIIRDTALSKSIKLLYDYKCQLCETSISLLGMGADYAEAHHIKPLGHPHEGPDVLENIICVCPNCHVKLDYGAIELIQSSFKLLDDSHQLNLEYLTYHNDHIHHRLK